MVVIGLHFVWCNDINTCMNFLIRVKTWKRLWCRLDICDFSGKRASVLHRIFVIIHFTICCYQTSIRASDRLRIVLKLFKDSGPNSMFFWNIFWYVCSINDIRYPWFDAEKLRRNVVHFINIPTAKLLSLLSYCNGSTTTKHCNRHLNAYMFILYQNILRRDDNEVNNCWNLYSIFELSLSIYLKSSEVYEVLDSF